MYFDQSVSHHRFAAYRVDGGSDVTDVIRGSDDWLREQTEREYGLKSQQLSQQMSIARMNSSNQRAATASAAKNARAQIKLATRQLEELGIPELELKKWVAQKNDELARMSFGLDVIKTAVAFRSSPDQYWMGKDFEAAVPGLLARNLSAPTEAPSEQPKPQTLEDLVAKITGGTAGAGTIPGGTTTPAASVGDTSAPSMTPQDAVKAVVDGAPPSPYAGLTEGDQATLKNIKSIFESGLDFRAWDQLNPNQQALLVGGGKRLGRSTDTDLWRMQSQRSSQGDARAA